MRRPSSRRRATPRHPASGGSDTPSPGNPSVRRAFRPAGPPAAALAAALLLSAAAPRTAPAQPRTDTLRVPNGPSLQVPRDTLKEMLERTRRRQTVLEEDPDVLYYVGTRGGVTLVDPAPAYPWNAVTVESDSVARIAVPGNYREARRAYDGYAVETMERVRRGAPAARCSEAVEREVEVVSAFVDGWIVARTLYGGPAFPPLDAFAFARQGGHLPALVVALGDSRLGECRRRWARDHPGKMEAYREWRAEFDASAASAPPAPGR